MFLLTVNLNNQVVLLKLILTFASLMSIFCFEFHKSDLSNQKLFLKDLYCFYVCGLYFFYHTSHFHDPVNILARSIT